LASESKVLAKVFGQLSGVKLLTDMLFNSTVAISKRPMVIQQVGRKIQMGGQLAKHFDNDNGRTANGNP